MITVRASSLLAGARKVYDVLSDFDPELERIEIDHGNSEATLFFDVEVPDSSLVRKGNIIKFERPVNFTLDVIRSKDHLQTYEIEEVSDSEYRIPAAELAASEEYRLIVSGTPSREAIKTLIRKDHFKGRIGRKQYEHNIVYNNGAITWDDDTVVTIINNYQDKIQFDERYLPRWLRKELDKISEDIHSNAWSTQYDPEKDAQKTSTSLEDLSDKAQTIISKVMQDSHWWFSSQIMCDFITVEGQINYYDMEIKDSDAPIPRAFTVVSRTDFGGKQTQTKGTIIFEKEDFWEKTKEEHLKTE